MLTEVHWISTGQIDVLKRHHIETLEQLASFELRDSMADVIPIDGLRVMAKRARQALALPDPLAMIGAAAGQHPGTPVRYAGGVSFGGEDV